MNKMFFADKFNLIKLILLSMFIDITLVNPASVYSQDSNNSSKEYICQITYQTQTQNDTIKSNQVVKTMIKTPERLIEFIDWQGEYAVKNCQFTTRRLQELHDSGLIQSLVKSIYAYNFEEYQAICLNKNNEQNGNCQPEDILMYLSFKQDSQAIITHIKSLYGPPTRSSRKTEIFDPPCPPLLCD